MAKGAQPKLSRHGRQVLTLSIALVVTLLLFLLTLVLAPPKHVEAREWAWLLALALLGTGLVSLVAVVVVRKGGGSALGYKILAGVTLVAALVVASLNAVGVPEAAVNQSPEARTAAENLSVAQLVVLILGFIGVVVTAIIAFQRQANDEARLGYELSREQHQRFSDAAEMLAHDSPVMQLAGLNRLWELATSVPESKAMRSSCISLICGWLRATSPAAMPLNWELRPPQQKVAIEEAVLMLARLLHHRDEEATYGRQPRYSLDLSGTTLPSLTLEGRLLNALILTDSVLVGKVILHRAIIGTANFDGTHFHDIVSLVDAQIQSRYSMKGATFHRGLVAEKVAFGEEMQSANATFEGNTAFIETHFAGHADFTSAQFRRGSLWGDARFSRTAFFWGTEFYKASDFADAKFEDFAFFVGTKFHQRARFERATFTQGSSFADAHFAKQASDDEWLTSASFPIDPTRPFPGASYSDSESPNPGRPPLAKGG